LSKRTWLRLLAALAATAPAATVDHTGWLPFYIPWDDTSRNATNLSWAVEAPAGRRGFVQVGDDGRFRFQDGTRARFSGFVSVAQANLPDSADAPRIAAHLRRFGVNFMRVHLTDVDGIYGLFRNSTTNTRELDPIKMRKFDWFLKCLRDQGIYVNFCVQAGRVFKTGDGIPAPITNDQSKFVSLFDPTLIGLQKELAGDLAKHVNPFTGLAYKDDPAVATWELTNENQLFQGWLSWGSSAWDSASATHPAGIAGYYFRALDTLWNGWLAARYETDAAVAAQWSGSSAAANNLVANPSFETGTTGWGWWADADKGAAFTVRRTAAAALSGGYGLQIAVESQGANTYDASVNYSRMSVAKGRSYRLRFSIKGTEPSSVVAEFLKESVWTWYGSTTCATDTTWSVCESYFTAPADIVDSLRFNLSFGRSTGTFWVDSVELAEYAGDGLREGESITTNSVRRSSRSTVGSLADERARDEARFYADLEGRYLDGLRSYLKDTLGVKTPVTFTNNWYGQASIASQSRADYMDAHWYWQHPDFPNGWSATDYTIANTPLAKDPDGGTAAQFSWNRVAGKPFVGSEYNHPFPNQYLCEAPAFYFGYMGFLDADGALLHAYIDYTPRYKDTWNDQFFNVGTNPVLMTQLPLANLFRTGRIAPALAQTTIDVSENDWTLSAKRFRDGFPFGGSVSSFLTTPMRWGRFDADISTSPILVDPGPVARTNTGELSWDRTAGILAIDNPWWQGAVGYLKKGVKTAKLELSGMATTGGRDFAAVHMVSADSLPLDKTRHKLLLTSARIENQSTVWNPTFTALTTVHKPGDTVVCEPVTGLVSFDAGRTDSVSVYPLDSRGNRLEALPLSRADDTTTWFTLRLPGTTLWYEIALGDARSPVGVRPASRADNRLDLRPVRGGWRVAPIESAPDGSHLEWEVRGVNGRILSKGAAAARLGALVASPAGAAVAVVDVRLVAGGVLRTRYMALAPVPR
jgi:hypothetical protein